MRLRPREANSTGSMEPDRPFTRETCAAARRSVCGKACDDEHIYDSRARRDAKRTGNFLNNDLLRCFPRSIRRRTSSSDDRLPPLPTDRPTPLMADLPLLQQPTHVPLAISGAQLADPALPRAEPDPALWARRQVDALAVAHAAGRALGDDRVHLELTQLRVERLVAEPGEMGVRWRRAERRVVGSAGRGGLRFERPGGRRARWRKS